MNINSYGPKVVNYEGTQLNIKFLENLRAELRNINVKKVTKVLYFGI